MTEKEHKGLQLKVEGTLLSKIGTLMDGMIEKGTKGRQRLKQNLFHYV